eukprot:scaffold4.g4747.t1
MATGHLLPLLLVLVSCGAPLRARELRVAASPDAVSVGAVCADDTLFCQSFPADAAAALAAGSGNGSIALLSYTGPPVLCLPKPAGCGKAGGLCCPLTGDSTDPSTRCSDANTVCLVDQQYSNNLTGLLTSNDYKRLLKDPHGDVPEAAQRSLFGTCVVFAPSSCGAAGGLCGPRLPAPAPQCADEVQACGAGFFCQLQEGQLQDVGLCTAVPGVAGKLGQQCLPPGNYSDGSVHKTPFCNDTARLAEFDVYCHAPLGRVNESECRRLPVTPRDCGSAGKSCCPSSYHVVTDRALPPVCEEGSYCASPIAGADPVCMANPRSAGRPGARCRATTLKGATTYACDDGAYCDGSVDAADLGLTPDQLTCKPCGSALDMPRAYHAVCGIGTASTDAAAGAAAAKHPLPATSPAAGASTKPGASTIPLETHSCKDCLRRRLLRR